MGRIRVWRLETWINHQEFLDAEQEGLGPLYPMYCECDFYNSASTWYKPEMFQYSDYGEDMWKLIFFYRNDNYVQSSTMGYRQQGCSIE